MSGITLWQFGLDGPVDAALPLLDGEELQGFRRYTAATAATAFARRRAIRRVLIGERLGVAPASLKVSQDGKPVIEEASLHFSTSHSGPVGIVAVSDRPVGIDIEVHQSGPDAAMTSRILSPAELLSLPPAPESAALLRHWCGKEAFLKAVGTGLDLGALPLITLPTNATDGWSPVMLEGRLARYGNWFVTWPDIGEGCTTAVVAPEPATLRIADPATLLDRYGL